MKNIEHFGKQTLGDKIEHFKKQTLGDKIESIILCLIYMAITALGVCGITYGITNSEDWLFATIMSVYAIVLLFMAMLFTAEIH